MLSLSSWDTINIYRGSAIIYHHHRGNFVDILRLGGMQAHFSQYQRTSTTTIVRVLSVSTIFLFFINGYHGSLSLSLSSI